MRGPDDARPIEQNSQIELVSVFNSDTGAETEYGRDQGGSSRTYSNSSFRDRRSFQSIKDFSTSKVDHSQGLDKYLHWWKPVLWMIGLMGTGVAFALGHHIGYQKLDGKSQDAFSQSWAHNLGNAAAFIVKTSFTLAVSIAFQEMLWFNARRRALKVSTLDSLFTILANPLNFFSVDALKNAPLVTVLAAIAWTIPLSAILSPGTLTIGPRTVWQNSTCLVPTFPVNTSTFFGVVPHGTGVYGANEATSKMADEILPQGTILDFTSPCGSNCSFQQAFFGPALQCVNSTNPHYTDPEFISQGSGAYVFYNGTSLGHWGLNSKMDILITYQNTSQPEGPGMAVGRYATLVCSAYNATYDLTIEYADGQPLFQTRMTYHEPLLNLSESENAIAGFEGENLLRTNFVTLVREIYETYLVGQWEATATAQYADPDTRIADTSLAGTINGKDDWKVNKDFLTGIPELLTNLTLSTLSTNAANVTTTCTSSKTFQAYRYERLWLVLPYSLALFLSVVAFTAGVLALSATGMRTGGMFSQILVTTRNPRLDELSQGNSLSSSGAVLLSKQPLRLGELKKDNYGGGDGDDPGVVGRGTGHAAFGPREQVLSLVKARKYR